MKQNEKKQNSSVPAFWHKGEGMTRRSHNINVVMESILQGLTYQQIWNIAGEFFTSKKFDEYYNFALNRIKNSDKESFMDYVKRTKKETKKKKARNNEV